MGKKVIECDYCHSLISEEDAKCPSCGANCSDAIKRYRKEKEEKEKAEREKAMKVVGDFANTGFKTVHRTFIITLCVVVFFIAFIMFMIITSSNRHASFDNNSSSSSEVIEQKQEVVTVGYQEEAVTSTLKAKLSSYELYAYHSEHFDSYNTPAGYQKIAFHFELENTSDSDIYLWSEKIGLTADDYEVKTSSLKAPGSNFATVIQGKEIYEDISNGTVGANSKLKGYVGYLVPTDKKELKFTIGKYIIIKMDNPAYKG